jgi:hypothetical protein
VDLQGRAAAPNQCARLCIHNMHVSAPRSQNQVPERKGRWALPQCQLGAHRWAVRATQRERTSGCWMVADVQAKRCMRDGVCDLRIRPAGSTWRSQVSSAQCPLWGLRRPARRESRAKRGPLYVAVTTPTSSLTVCMPVTVNTRRLVVRLTRSQPTWGLILCLHYEARQGRAVVTIVWLGALGMCILFGPSSCHVVGVGAQRCKALVPQRLSF